MSDPQLIKLANICQFISGGTPSRSVECYFQGTIPWITGADITSDIITSAREYIRPYPDLIFYSCNRRLVKDELPVVKIKSG